MNTSGLFLVTMALVIGCNGDAAQVSPATLTPEWQTVKLLENETVLATLKVQRVASPSDESWIYVELQNLGKKPLLISQAWLNLDGERYDPATGKLLCSGGLTPGNIFHGSLTSGVVRIVPEVCNLVSLNLGPPPPNGLRLEGKARLSLSLGDGRNCESPPEVKFSCLWQPPRADGLAAMRRRLQQLLGKPEYKFEHGYALGLLLNQPEVASAFTAEQLLTALKLRQGSVDGRDRLAQELGKRFSNETTVVNYVVDRIKAGQIDETFWIWNTAFVLPLIQCFEKTGQSMVLDNVLAQHRSDWQKDPALVSRVSQALVTHRPLLSTNVFKLDERMLYAWSVCAHEASLTADKSLIKLLAPALDDQRFAIHPHENQLANRVPRRRVCEHAYLAIATLLEMPIPPGLMTFDAPANQAALERAIADLKQRLKNQESRER